MTTYLTVDEVSSSQVDREECVFAFCSPECRSLNRFGHLERIDRDDFSYEFDEKCNCCGREIPASAGGEREA